MKSPFVNASKFSVLQGLIVCGGKSARMGMDKSLLAYHKLPQRYFLYKMMESICDKVFLSCNHEQLTGIQPGYNVIVDAPKYENIGPMAGLLSAFEFDSTASFLAVGCDYPFIRKEDLKKLVDARNDSAFAVSYFNKELSIEEPLLTIYENGAHSKLRDNFLKRRFSLKYFLREIDAIKISPSRSELMVSVDTPEQYRNALRSIGK